MTNLEQQRDAWDQFAQAYDDAITPISMRVAEEALALAGLSPGEKLLDVAAGPGALSLPAARLGAEVLSVDYSPAMVELLQQRARDEGFANLAARVMDGTALDLADGSFDLACSQLGIMLFPDRAAGLRELARVSRQGGRGVMVVFGPPERVPLAMFFRAVAQANAGFAMTPPRQSPLFCLSDPEDLVSEMTEAGFQGVDVHQVETSLDVESSTELWNLMLGGAPAIAGLLRGLAAEQQRATRTAFEQLFGEQFGSGGASLPMAFNVGIGRR